MADRETVKRIRSADNKHELQIFRCSDGRFGYVGHSEVTESGETFWTPTEFSGIYDSIEAAERGALADMLWLRTNRTN